MSQSISYTALSYALAALGSSKESGGSASGTVSVKVAETITLPSGEKAKVLNIGNDTEVLLQFFIPQGLNGNQWYISNKSPGEIVSNAEEGDLILYSNGDVYKIIGGIPTNQYINIIGKEGFSPSIVEKINTDDEYILTVINKDGSYDTPNLKGFSSEDLIIIDGGELEN